LRNYLIALLLCACLANAQNSEPLTNDIIIKMVQAGVSTETIIRTIAASDKEAFRFLNGDIAVLQNAKVPDDVIKAMSARAFGRPIPGLPASSQRTTPAPIGANAQNPPIVVTQTPAPAPAPAPAPFQAAKYQGRGMWDVDFLGSALIPNSSAADTTGIVSGEAGYFVSRGSLIGGSVTGTFNRGAQDVFLSGGYRYFFGSQASRVRPYVGGSAGGNLLTGSGLSDVHFLAIGGGGIRYFVAPHVAIDFGYGLYYVHSPGATFAQSTLSTITVGFAHVFGGR
jgi:hypothetical protein